MGLMGPRGLVVNQTERSITHIVKFAEMNWKSSSSRGTASVKNACHTLKKTSSFLVERTIGSTLHIDIQNILTYNRH